MKSVGRLLGEVALHDGAVAAPVYLRSFNGTAVELLPFTHAQALLRRVSASSALTVTGDLNQGFAWPIPGAHPRRSHVVSPLAAPSWPASDGVTCALIELWWAADQVGAGYRVMSYNRLFDDPFTAYVAACWLWARPDTGQGAATALLYGRDRVPYAVEQTATTCARLPTALVAGLVANRSERFTTALPPIAAGSLLQGDGRFR